MCACALPLSSSSHWKKLLGGGVERRGVSCGRKEIKKTSYNWCHAFLISLQTACHLHFPIFYFPVLFHIVSFWHASQHKICPHMYIGMLPGERITLKLSIKTLCRVLGSTRFSWAVLQCKHSHYGFLHNFNYSSQTEFLNLLLFTHPGRG